MTLAADPNRNAVRLQVVCLITFLAGLGLGWHTIHVQNEPLPVMLKIPRSHADHLTLTQPLSGGLAPAQLPGSLRIWLYRAPDLVDPALAETVQPPGFNLHTPWLADLLKAKKLSPANAFSLRMSGQIQFAAPQTKMHLRCRNGFRLLLRNAVGEEQQIESWTDALVDDFEFQVTAEPGYYSIEIDFFSYGGDAYFNLWSEADDFKLFPAAAAP